MAGTNQFLTFATSSGANLITLSEYNALSARTTGFQSGVARSSELNRVWRQSAFMSAAMGQYISLLGSDALDDGNIDNLTSSIARIGNSMKSIAIIAGTTIALDATTEAIFPIIRFTGYININTTINMPLQSGKWTIINDTTGSADVIIKTTSGTGAVATRNQATQMVCDGTNVRRLSAGDSVPVGSVSATVRQNTPDDGYLMCWGQEISRTTYANLYAVCGTAFGGGNGSTTFNVPDLRGVFIRGYDSGRRVDPDRTFASYQADAMQNLSGTLSQVTGGNNYWDGVFAQSTSVSQNHIHTDVSGSDRAITFNASNVARTADENRPKNIAMNYQIKY